MRRTSGWRLTAVIAICFVLAAANLYLFRHDFAALGARLLGREQQHVEAWQRWASHYDQLFGALPWGEKVGVQVAGQKSSGVVLERTADGMVARHALFMERAAPGMVLTFEPEAAEKLLASVPDTEPGAIWQIMKDLLYDRQITVWSDPDLDRLQEGGYLALLRAVDTRPPGVDWPEIKRRLGEVDEPPDEPTAADDEAGTESQDEATTAH